MTEATKACIKALLDIELKRLARFTVRRDILRDEYETEIFDQIRYCETASEENETVLFYQGNVADFAERLRAFSKEIGIPASVWLKEQEPADMLEVCHEYLICRYDRVERALEEVLGAD